MFLSEFMFDEGETLFRDGIYDTMGILSNQQKGKMLSFITDLKYIGELQANKNISCIVCKKEMIEFLPNHVTGVILSDDPCFSFWRLHNEQGAQREYFDTVIGHHCNISPLAYIAPKNVIIGDNVLIEEFVSIKENTQIGNNVIVRAGCVIGGQGFEFKTIAERPLYPVKHQGGVIIENDVELQQLTNVSRAVFAWDDTVIGEGTKIDALVHIAHADKIGRQCRFAAGAAIGGSTQIGDRVWLGINAIISNGLRIENDARVSLGSVVTKNVEEGQIVTGNFAIDHSKFISNLKKQCK